MRREYATKRTVPAPAVKALQRLSLDKLHVTSFSQIVHDAFAGVTLLARLVHERNGITDLKGLCDEALLSRAARKRPTNALKPFYQAIAVVHEHE